MTGAYLLALIPLAAWVAYGLWMAYTDSDPYNDGK